MNKLHSINRGLNRMNKILSLFMISLLLVPFIQSGTVSAKQPTQDTEELRLQDMLMILLTPTINKELEKYYGPQTPGVTPWKIDIIETKRVQHFRGFILDITLEIEPTTGHHVSVGRDKMTFRISYGPSVELKNYTHLASYDLPQEPSTFDYQSLPYLFKYVLSKPFK